MFYVLELYSYWKKNPPVHILLRVLAGYNQKQKTNSLTEVEEKAVVEYGGFSPTPSNKLPLAVQAAILKTSKGSA